MSIHQPPDAPDGNSAPLSGDALQRYTLRVFYEDTDAAGIVYYANYFRFLERARTEFLRALGHQQQALMHEGIAFAVRSVSAEYLKPAKLDDLLAVETSIESMGRAQVVFAQCIRRGEDLLLDAKIRVACIDPQRGKPIPMPRPMHDQFAALIAPHSQGSSA